jgi:hypothetical protein
MNILFLCRRKDVGGGQWAFVRALERRGVQVTCVGDHVPVDEDIPNLVACCAERPSLILQPELDPPLLPKWLDQIPIATACFQIDTYAFTNRRIAWSMLFDHPIVFHPGYEARFREAGHPGAITIYHAASRDLFDKPEIGRDFDVGSVGRTFARVHRSRRRVLTKLAESFQLNDWEKLYSFEEMAEVYRRSKIVVNVPRDDFPQDANMRAFESMAAGCLLISRVPSELAAIGLEEGVHFVGYRHEREITGLVSKYLSAEEQRRTIAAAGKNKVLAEHTYDDRVDSLLQRLEQRSASFCAPARQWSEGRTRLHYLDYYASHRLFDHAYREWRRLARLDFPNMLRGLMAIGRAWVAQLRRTIAAMKR